MDAEEIRMTNAPQAKLNAIALSQAIQDAKETFMIRAEMMAVIAAEMKQKYDALITAGFTAEQALELCKSKAI
jgi:hypothetical protein